MRQPTAAQIHSAIREDGEALANAALKRAQGDSSLALAILGCAAEVLLLNVPPSVRAEWLAAFEPDDA
jgi:hypothetical protein